MSAERIIGVDYGTSTSVIRVKRYQDGKPVGDRLETKPVTFNMGSTIVPTLIQKLPSGDLYYGYDAEIPRRKTETFQNFKADIENPDEDIRRRARELTAEYFTYLAKSYQAQSEGSHLGKTDDKERTIISYPVKWSNETKAFMIQTAKDAGFRNVEGIDEAQAAIQAVTVQNADLLTRKGYFQDGVPVNILLIDMGAGTTDLVLCRHTPGAQPKTDILSTWPQGGNTLFGGREMDELLRNYIAKSIPKEGTDLVLKKIAIEKYKAWKEGIVSPALEKGESVDYFNDLDNLLNLMDIDAEYSVDRASLEDFAADYLRQLPELVNGCVSAAGLSGDDVDLVILTGGHSQWYFVREMLSGELDRFGEIGLGKIQADLERIIPITLPQETVALGLAYGPLQMEVPVKPQPVEDNKTNPSIIVEKEIVETDKSIQGDVFPLKYDPYSRIRPVIATGEHHTVGLKKDGTVVETFDGYQFYSVNNWRDIVAIAAGHDFTVGLKKDGTVIAKEKYFPLHCRNVKDWQGIVAISAGSSHVIGLKKNGTVVADGDNRDNQCNVGDWRDIVAIDAGSGHTVGLKKDGTVVAVGWNSCGQRNVSNWRDIVAISAGSVYTVGLKKDGTIIRTYDEYLMPDDEDDKYHLSDWRDIVAISVGGLHIVGLKKDGTVIAVGDNRDGQCNVSDWRDIVAIAARSDHTVGLKKDGTVVAIGRNSSGQCDVGEYGRSTKEKWFGFAYDVIKVKQTPWKLF